ncbi:MAG: amylo-alpha-1,6-glucosidase [Elainellaceae cyanobacterium]
MISLQMSEGTRDAVDQSLSSSDLALIRAAKAVLNRNWLGSATKPAPAVSPYQWSWDSGFIAMGYAHYDQPRAMQELRSLFEGQWRNGLLPHTVFHHWRSGSSRYFPGPDVWQTERSPYSPSQVQTSGIVQPPIHATTAWHLYRYATDHQSAYQFLIELFPRLVAWHHYLYRERNPAGDGLVYIRHPWESGQNNSPLWDASLQRVAVEADELPAYHRIELRQVHRTQDLSDESYGRYATLLLQARNHAYDETAIRSECPFLVQDVLFNALLVKANRDLAAIARLLNFDPSPFDRWAEQTAISMNQKLWNEELGYYQNYDLVTQTPEPVCMASSFTPLYAQVPGLPQAHRMVQHLLSPAFYSPLVRTCGIPSCSRQSPGFHPGQHWRGPIWLNLNWLLYQGLKTYSYTIEAEQLRQASLILPKQGGLYEYFHADTGKGLGANSFAWTAALVLDLLLGHP